MMELRRTNPKVSRSRIKYKEDKISGLGDDIIALIISRLSLREAVRTSILSSRWKYVWTGITRLNFDTPKELWNISKNRSLTINEKQNLVNWVNHVLDSHNSCFLQKFRISLPLDDCNVDHRRQLDKWFKFALSKKLESLEIDLRYALPHAIFLDSLKSVSLDKVGFDDQMAKFLLSSPLLEVLSLRNISKLRNIEIVGTSLKLKYLEMYKLIDMESIKICNVGLESLRSRSTSSRVLILHNLASIVQVDIDHDFCHGISNLGKMMRQIDHHQPVQLHLNIRQSHVHAEFYNYRSSGLSIMEKVKILKLEIDGDSDNTLIYVCPLILAIPDLEKLLIKIEWSDTMNNNRNIHWNEIITRPNDPVHKHLKIVEYEGYACRLSDHELANYFLEHYISLEKFIVKPHCQRYAKKVRVSRGRARRQLGGLNYDRVKLVIL